MASNKWAFTVNQSSELWAAIIVEQDDTTSEDTASINVHVEEVQSSHNHVYEFTGSLYLGGGKETLQYKDSKTKLADSEWTDLLRYIFLGQLSAQERPAIFNQAEVGLNLDEDHGRLTINIERVVGAGGDSGPASIDTDQLRVRLGTVVLDKMRKQTDLMYTSTSLLFKFSLILGEINSNLRERANAYDIIQSQMNELANSKKEFEQDMIERFALLLNEKKAKIRQLETQISTSGISMEDFKDKNPNKRPHDDTEDTSVNEFYSVDEAVNHDEDEDIATEDEERTTDEEI